MRWIMLIKGACICGFYVLQAMAFFAYRREAKKVDRNNPHNSILRYLTSYSKKSLTSKVGDELRSTVY